MSETDKIRAVLSVSTISTTISMAERLAELSGEFEEEEPYLAGCSVVAQASALDQATENAIINLAMNYAVVDGLEVSRVPFYKAVYDSLGRSRGAGQPASLLRPKWRASP